MKEESWNGHKIRFVEIDGEWWAIGIDVADALGYKNKSRDINRHVDKKDRQNYRNGTSEINNRGVTVINEVGIYALIFGSELPEAKQFKRWVGGILKKLRLSLGLEGFEIFRMLDKEHQREAMKRLSNGLRSTRPPERVDFIKANTIANKAVSTKHGYGKMIKKADMSPEMLAERQAVLDDTVNLMLLNSRYDMGLSISEQIYRGVTPTGPP